MLPNCEGPSTENSSGVSLNWSIPRLRKVFLKDQKYVQTRRLYVSRKCTDKRYFDNEEKVAAFLKGYGFERVYMEEYSVKEQAILFAEAEVIVGQHGAALTNFIFCAPNTKVLELMHPNFFTPCFWEIAVYNQLDYSSNFVQSVKKAKHQKLIGQIKRQFVGRVDLKVLKSFVETL